MGWKSHLLEKRETEIISETLADVLAAPAEGERELLAAIRKTAAGDCEKCEEAAAVFARTGAALTDAYGGKVPAEVLKAMRAAAGVNDATSLGVDEEDEADDQELDPNAEDGSDDYKPRVKPGKKRKPKPVAKEETKPKRTASEVLTDVIAFAKSTEIKHDQRALESIERVAADLRKTSGYKLTRPQSVAKALELRPDLYSSYNRDQLRKMGALNDSPVELRKAESAAERFEARLNAATESLRAEDPNLTRAAAVLKALKLDPFLHADYEKETR